MASYLIAVLLWFIDLRFCSLLSERLPALGLFNPELHALWHVLVSCGFYSLLLVTAHIRLQQLGERPEIAWRLGVVPYLRQS
jgi:dihydroceramidase